MEAPTETCERSEREEQERAAKKREEAREEAGGAQQEAKERPREGTAEATEEEGAVGAPVPAKDGRVDARRATARGKEGADDGSPLLPLSPLPPPPPPPPAAAERRGARGARKGHAAPHPAAAALPLLPAGPPVTVAELPPAAAAALLRRHARRPSRPPGGVRGRASSARSRASVESDVLSAGRPSTSRARRHHRPQPPPTMAPFTAYIPEWCPGAAASAAASPGAVRRDRARGAARPPRPSYGLRSPLLPSPATSSAATRPPLSPRRTVAGPASHLFRGRVPAHGSGAARPRAAAAGSSAPFRRRRSSHGRLAILRQPRFSPVARRPTTRSRAARPRSRW